jgi:superfamily II DNA or RNA helicase
MTNTAEQATSFSPGSLVRVRNREWVVQTNDDPDYLKLRPLGGSDDDIQIILPSLESTKVESATFPPPDSSTPGSYSSAILLRDALRLKLRSGAGPFRSFGHIAVEPRAYQLVPLLMALKMPVVRLLIADDVGIGKTIEAGLIVRELLDRGEISRFAVLCPPHLVEQWQSELQERFHIRAAAVTASSVARLEREIPQGESLFAHFPAVVVSLDYIKSESHRDHFLSGAPECIVVDEAHTCTMTGSGRQLRFALLKKLTADTDRHLIMLTATPHSGDDDAFGNLLSLLNPAFAGLSSAGGSQSGAAGSDSLRADLALHFVQRRRIDIGEWQDNSIFPTRKVKDASYALTGEWGSFFDEVREYCYGIAQRAENEKGEKARMMWYATLALLRCISSSPAAAASALGTRLSGRQDSASDFAEDEFSADERIDDGVGEELASNDLEPAARIDDPDRKEELALLEGFLARSNSLRGPARDPKLAKLIKEVENLLKEKFRPVIFCRYIATAEYVAEELKKMFPKAVIDCVTGLLTSDERAEKVALLSEEEQPILVATDCLSEGVNLQEGFNAVVHYDLAWNPTRHEQREGRVDRFGQESKEVRCIMLYGADNPVDGFIFNVILKKADTIKSKLGVLVPMPDNDRRMRFAVVKAALMKKGRSNFTQTTFDFGEDDEIKDIVDSVNERWTDAMEKAKANRTVFAQRRLKPEDVIPEWNRQMAALGDSRDVERFVVEALTRLSAKPDKAGDHRYIIATAPLQSELRERLSSEGIEKNIPVSFEYPPAAGFRHVHRSHSLVSILADYLLETALSRESSVASRSGAFETASVDVVTTIYLLRIRHRISNESRTQKAELMAEESVAIAVAGRTNPVCIPGDEVEKLLDRHPEANLDLSAITREVQNSIKWYADNLALFTGEASRRAETLQADHTRVRSASNIKIGKTVVEPCLPPDLIGVYVLLPSGDI